MPCASEIPDACLEQPLRDDMNDGANKSSKSARKTVLSDKHDKTYHGSTKVALKVQATQEVLDHSVQPPWTKIQLQGRTHLPMRMVAWALTPWESLEHYDVETGPTELWRRFSLLATATRIGLIYLPLHLLFMSQDILAKPIVPTPPGPPSWPRYARNELDMRPKDPRAESEETSLGETKLFKATRLMFPRRLMMYADKSWILVKEPPSSTGYIFMSWHWASFGYNRRSGRKEALKAVTELARHATLDAGLKAYWLDVQCITENRRQSGDAFSSDVYGMSDIVRNAQHVAILLPADHPYYKRAWARRLWTMPEGLLANGKLRIWTDTGTQYVKEELDRVQMTCQFWRPFEEDDRQFPARILSEYFEDRIELTRLELITTAIAALSRQESSNFTQADIAYALMGLLRAKITVNTEDSLFQAMTKLLSLTDDNEYVIERMLSSYQYPVKDGKDLLRKILQKDRFGSYLWQISARCEVVGIDDEDGVVFLNDCRTLPINHQKLPDYNSDILDKIRPFLRLAILILGVFTVTVSWLARNYNAMYHLPQIVILLAVIIALLISSNYPVTDQVFTLFEGALPLQELEVLIFGHPTSSLNYATTSSPLIIPHNGNDPPWLRPTNRERWIRELYTARAVGSEPEWTETPISGIRPTSPTSPTSPTAPTSPISPFLRRSSSSIQQQEGIYHPPLLSEHTLFTLLQVQSGKVYLVQAKRPPDTVVLAGTEGGMLRAVLCSSAMDGEGAEFLYKEAVVRMGMEVWECGTPRSWLRVGMLGSR